MPAQDWFESFFVEGRYSEQLERVPVEQTEREVEFMSEVLDLPDGARILDLCCGVGRHAVALAALGYRVAGLDLDAVISWFSSWGFYETDEEDAEVLAAAARALKAGGRFLLEVANREAVFGRFREREWHEEPDGTLVLRQRELDLVTSRDRVTYLVIHPDGRRSERWRRLRRYSLTELSQMLSDAGLVVERSWGDVDGSPYTLTSRRLIVLARKRKEGLA